jgi:hypothetical protein
VALATTAVIGTIDLGQVSDGALGLLGFTRRRKK